MYVSGRDNSASCSSEAKSSAIKVNNFRKSKGEQIEKGEEGKQIRQEAASIRESRVERVAGRGSFTK
jgi:hypothetical protein